MPELGDFVTYVKCPTCGGVGTTRQFTGSAIEEDTCPDCDGEKYIVSGFVNLDDVTDKLNDIMDKCNDIKEVVDEL